MLFEISSNIKAQSVSNPVGQYGWLNQNSLDTANSSIGADACHPTSMVNALTYLQNINPSLFGTNLTGGTNISSTQGSPNSYNNWVNTDQTLIGLMGTYPGSGTAPANGVPGTEVYLLRIGYYSDITVQQNMSVTLAALTNALNNGEAVVGAIAYVSGNGGHTLLINGYDTNSTNGTLYFVDPLDPSQNYSGTNVLGPVRQTSGTLTDSNGAYILRYHQVDVIPSNPVAITNQSWPTSSLMNITTLSITPSANTNSAWSNLVIGSNSLSTNYTISSGTNIYSNTIIGMAKNSSNNQLIVANTNTLLSNSVNLYVGNYGASNSMIITNGGVVAGEYGILGDYSTSCNNSVVVTGAGSVWTNAGNIAVGFDGSGNTLVISNGGAVLGGTDGVGGIIGADIPSSNNSVLVTGSNSSWSNRLDLYVGFAGNNNSMVISNEGTVTDSNGWIGNYYLSSNNVVQVTGTNSLWSNVGNLYVGNYGSSNSLIISNAGRVTDSNAYIGFYITGNPSNNSVTVTGTNSLWSNSGDLLVGYSGSSNSMVISNGGRVDDSNGYIGYTNTSSNNSVIVTGNNSLWSNAGSVMAGNAGNGNSLTISNGGRVVVSGSTNWLAIGENDGANSNVVTVTGSNSSLSVTGWLEVGWGSNSGNRMVIGDGGSVSDSNAYIGYTNGSSGNSALVTGTGSIWSNAGSFYVGYYGGGNSLVISNGAKVIDQLGSVGFHGDGNTAIVTGIGSLWSNAGSFSVGNCGSDSLLVVSNGGGVVSSSGYIAEVSRWTNCSAVITGSGSFWSNTGTLTIGSVANRGNNPSSGNSLTISDGGRVTGSNAVIANATNFFSNSVTVTGINSLWSNSGSVDLGVLGSLNVLVISNGGSVVATGIIETNGTTDGPLAVATTIGYSNASSNNSILITGTNSAMTNAGRLRIGYEGSGNLVTIANSGQLIGTRNANITIGYGTNSSNNSLLISGPGSLSSNNGGIYVGYYGSSNTLTLTDGAVLRSGSTNAAFYGSSTNFNDAYVGFGASSSNNAVLIDSNAQWIHSGTNYIGYVGSGTVTVANGGVLAASKILIGQYGDLDFGRYLESDSAGSVVGEIVFTANNDENFGINFNQTNTFNFSNNVSGPGWLCALGTGTTIISGGNTYSQYTKIDAGTVVAASTNALGTGYLQIGGTSDKATIILATNLTVGDFIWGSNGVLALTAGSQTLTVGAMTNLAGTIGGNAFDFQGGASSTILNNNTNILINFTTLSGFTTNSFSVLGMTGYSFSTIGSQVSAYLSTSANVGVYTGVTINGTLTVNSLTVNPLGTLQGTGTLYLTGGSLNVNGTLAPGNSPGTFYVSGGNLVMGSTSVWDEQIYSASVYDRVVVTGSAILNGTMNISTFGRGGLQFGQKYKFLTASGGISGAFSSIIAPEGFRGRLLVSGTQANILIAPASYTQLAQNRNQSNVATALNSFIPHTSGDQLVVSTSLDSLTASEYNQAFNAIMPTFYQQIATIAFNQANALNMELNQRLWGLRVAEGGGFSMSGLADNFPILEGQGDGGLEDGSVKGVLDSKKDILRSGLDNHWGMFVDGNGIFAQASSGNMLPGYNSESGGVTTGLTYKWNDNFASGIYCGYQGTYTKSGANGSGLGTGSSLIDNAVRFGVFGTYGQKDGKGLYANALAGGAYHNFQATRVIQYTGWNRTANSSPGAGELDSMLAAAYDIQKGKFTFGPTASLQYTYLGVNSVNEAGAQSLDFNSGGWNSSSMLSSAGAHAAYSWVAHKDVVVVPQINLSWQHEFMQNPYAISGNLGGTSPTFANWSATPIRDFLYTGVGFTLEFAKRWNTSFFYNAAAGNSHLISQNIFLSAGVKF